MARSYRGKEVDMVSLAKQNEKTVALGNAHMNAKGDILGKGGVVIKSREELIAESKLATHSQVATVNMKSDNVQEKTEIIEETYEDKVTVAKPKVKKVSPKYENITEEEKASIDELKGE